MPDRVLFIGAVHEARPALRALLESDASVAAVLTLPPERAARACGAVDLVPMATRHGVHVIHVVDVNSPHVIARIRELRPDLVVAVGWTRLLSPELLAIPARGCVGFHASLLPRHRGRAPVNWAILFGERQTGNTMLRLDAGVDSGDIIDQRLITIADEDTCADVYAKVGAAGAAMLRQHLPALLAGTEPRQPQETGENDVLPRRTPAMGITVWHRPARAVHDWIRALTLPYPGAFSMLDGHAIMLWRSAVPGADEPDGPPGMILECSAAGMRVGAASGSVLVTQVSGRGEPPAAAGAWCRAAGIVPGMEFDPVDPETGRWALGSAADLTGTRE